MRIYAVACLSLAVAGCNQADGPKTQGPAGQPLAQESAGMECAIGADSEWSRGCTIERDGDILTIRHPDGGFRRFRQLSDGRGLEAADGSEQAKIQMVDGKRIEVRIGGDRYRLPVRIAPKSR